MEIKKIDQPITQDIKVFLKENWMLIAAVIYLMFPVDILPDIVPVLGVGDDALVLIGSLLIKYAKFKKNKK